MKSLLDISQCFRDSHEFRLAVHQSDAHVSQLEGIAKVMMKSTRQSNDLANELSTKNSLFIEELKHLAKYEQDEVFVEKTMNRFADVLTDVERSRRIMVSQLNQIFVDQTEAFIKRDVTGVRDFKKTFDKASDNADSSLERFMSKRIKDPGLTEAAEEVHQARLEFHQRSIGYCMTLNDFHYGKRTEYLETILAYMQMQYAFFHQGYEYFKDLQTTMRELSVRLEDVRKQHTHNVKHETEMREAALKDAGPLYNPMSSTPSVPVNGSTAKSGYLMKRGSGKIAQVWSRRWFSIKNDLLIYSTRGKDEQPTVLANLRLCSVKPRVSPELGIDRRNCFELITPVKSFVLQAENERELMDWIEVLQNAIGKALNSEVSTDLALRGMSTKEKYDDADYDQAGPKASTTSPVLAGEKVAEEICAIEGNNVCADCGSPNPEWASINLGIVLCIECSGIHRSLGVQVSKVRSLTLDKWESESFDAMLSLGNQRVNAIYEVNFTNDKVQRATAKTDRQGKEKWIHAKYVLRQFVDVPKENVNVNIQYWNACKTAYLVDVIKSIAHGADVDYKNPEFEGQTALSAAIENGDAIMIHFLLQWNCNIDLADANGLAPLHYAVKARNSRLVATLLKRRANSEARTAEGKLPIDLAIDLADPDLVTMLRLHQFELQELASVRREPSSLTVKDTEAISSEDIRRSANEVNVSPSVKGDEAGDQKMSRISPTKVAKNFFNAVRTTSPIRSSAKVSQSGVADTDSTAIEYEDEETGPTPSSKSQQANPNDPAYKQMGAAAMQSLASATAYANRFFKGGFTKVHADMAPHEDYVADRKTPSTEPDVTVNQ